MGNTSFKLGSLLRGALALATGAYLLASAVPAQAGCNWFWATYDIGTGVGNNVLNDDTAFAPPDADNVIRLIDPEGCGNSGVGNGNCATETDLCAMVYVFDDDQEMGECCGCRITPNELQTYSVRNNLVNNWSLATQDNSSGTLVVVNSDINDPGSPFFGNGCGNLSNPACHGGCSPTITPIVAGDTTMVSSITHDQVINGVGRLTEIALFDQCSGEPVNNAYLVAQCAAIIGNGTSRNGYCHCPDRIGEGVSGAEVHR